jgi:cellulose synthase/poly-beta-1,6-N-acetylglucosamine synthase-like glycosyltransferase
VITLLRLLYGLAVALPVLSYVAYPLVVRLAARMAGRRRTTASGDWPSVTVAIAAHNEERDIARVVESILAAEYPGPPIRVLVGLDGCTDGTAAVLASIGDPRVGWLDLERAGKAATDNRLAAAIDSDVIVTTAAGAVYDPGALVRLVEPFRDPTVGCVSGVFAPRQDGTAAAGGEGLYWRMEYAVMAAESTLGILACASGTSMAHRRSIFRPIPLDSDGDVSLAPNAAEQGYRVQFVRDAIVRDDGPGDMKTVLRNRRRMALRALPTTATFVGRLFRARRPGPALALLVHKLLRWIVPWCIPLWALAAAGLALLGDRRADVVTLALLAAALLATGLAAVAGPRIRGAVISFATAQLAFALATLDAVRGRRARMWNRPQP